MVTVLGAYWHSDLTIHNTSACLVKDGKLLASVNEDRITRIKLDSNPPRNSIREVLRITKTDPKDVDAVAIPFYGPFKSWVLYSTLESTGLKSKIKGFLGGMPVGYFFKNYRLKEYLHTIGIDAPIYFIRHHLAHASMSYYTSGMKEALIMTIDGSGDGQSTSLKIGEGNDIFSLASSRSNCSLGTSYSRVATALGFVSGNEEGKVTGLAAYGKATNVFDKYFKIKGLKVKGGIKSERIKRLKIDEKIFTVSNSIKYKSDANELIGKYSREDLAASIQSTLEKVTRELARRAMKKTGIKNICVGGGVALNVKMNKNISEESEDFFVPFEPSDTGTQIGAALYVSNLLGPFHPEKTQTSYYGNSYTNEEIKEVLEEWNLNYEKVNPAIAASELINEGKVIGFFQGKMEAGPRTLGNRSCLASAYDKNMRDKINSHLKMRDWFMPFAPSCLNEKKEEYFKNARESPLMMNSFDAVNPKEIPSVVHIDGTSRPQTVKKEVNPIYHELIKRCGGIVLNTSFNKHGEPIVRSPQDALLHLMRNNVEALVIGNYLIFHPNKKISFKKKR